MSYLHEERHKAIIIPVVLQDKGPPKFLTVRDSRHQEWIFVTGGCKKSEVDNPLRCGLRELEEETRGTFNIKSGSFTEFEFKSTERSPEEIRKEVFNLIKSAAKMELQDWSLDKVKQTGNMGDLTQVFGPNSGKGGFKGEVSFVKGVEGIEDLRSRLKTDLAPNSKDMERYLITYDELVNEKSITKPAPFIINLKNTDGKPYHLIGGHKRSTIALQLGIPVKALFIEF